jgi:DNA-binding MurR/RpiR family transcriptional regulator
MSKTSTHAHSAENMSPAQAAQCVGVSRWTIMRAIKSQDLLAFRDNKNQWKIASEVLKAWRPSIEHTGAESHIMHTQSVSEEVLGLREKLAAAVSRAEAAERARDQAEVDRDRWHELAMKPWWKRLIG